MAGSLPCFQAVPSEHLVISRSLSHFRLSVVLCPLKLVLLLPPHPHFLEGEGTYQGPQVIRPQPVLGIQLCNTLLHSQSDAVIYGLEGSERNNEVSLQSLENG